MKITSLFKSISKKVSILSIIGLCTLGLSGCGENIKNFLETDCNNAIMDRLEMNLKVLQTLHSNGFISDLTYKNYENSINVQQQYYSSEFTNIDLNNLGKSCPFLNNIHKLRYVTCEMVANTGKTAITYPNDKGEIISYSLKEHASDGFPDGVYISNTLIQHVTKFGSVSDSPGDVHTCRDTDLTPMNILGTDISTDMATRFNCPVYVLDWELITQDGNSSLDSVIEAVHSAITTGADGSRSVNDAILEKYFRQAEDASGKPITLGEDFNIALDMVRVTSENPTFNNLNSNDVSNELGLDLVISQYDVPAFTVRLQEINPVAWENLQKLLGMNDSKYIYSEANGGKFYVMEYPVWYLDSIKNETANSSTAIGTFAESGIGVNLYTQKILKYDPIYSGSKITGWSKTGTEISELVDSYLTLAGASNGDFKGKSAFMVNGTQDIDIALYITASGSMGTVKGARIILRDYLEATFAPNFVDESNLVVFGRKIRFLFKPENFDADGNIVIDKTQEMAVYVDKEGNNILDGNYLTITDFCSAQDLTLDKPRITRLNMISEKGTTVIPGQTSTTDKAMTVDQLDQVGQAGTSPIHITMMFPGDKIGRADYGDHGFNDNNSKQRFYAVATRKGIFNSGLYSNWINITDNTASLDWWNTYLNDNQFKYSVGHQEVNDYLLGNFGYELSQSGIIILDLDTIAFIQEEMNEESQTETAEFTRTIFVIIGWFLICYAIMLMLAWVIDTNLDIGIDLLNKLTLGSWIAVKYAEDIPAYDLSNNKYMPLSRVVVSSFIITAVALLLITVDIYSLVIAIIRVCGSIASQIQQMLSGK